MGRRICDAIASGQSLTKLCAQDDYPEERTVYSWLRQHPKFREMYNEARQDQCEHYAQLIVDIAREPLVGERVKILADGSREVTMSDNVERSKLSTWAVAWYASKVAPKKYGTKRPTETEDEGEEVYKVVVDF